MTESDPKQQKNSLAWTGGGTTLVFHHDAGHPVTLVSMRSDRAAPPGRTGGPPLVEIQALGHGRFPGSHRYADTEVGARLRYNTHTESHDGAGAELRITQIDPVSSLTATSVFRATDGVPAVRTWTEVGVEGSGTVRLQAVTSFATGAFLADSGGTVDEFDVVHADSDWAAESRWHRTPLRETELVAFDPDVHHHASRSRFTVTSRSSWSTGEHLPTGAVVSRDDTWTVCWQIEHNGAWHWELGETKESAYLALSGPTDAEHQWSTAVSQEQGFTTVPVSVAACAGGIDDAVAALTLQRRALHTQPHRARTLPVIFNDYMNTLMGNPTTEKLLPLVDAAAATGAEYFCVDAGWYDEDWNWWDSVGAWLPSRNRFPAGLGEVVERIRSRGMVPGLWLEPEVVGVRSPVARRLPDEAFFQRHGERVVEHGRFHLDLRHPSARAHVNEVVDRLVAEYGIGYFKLDYNIMPGPGTDRDGASPGEGLLGHNRAHLDWLDSVLSRHPDLLLENCASGAMRMDYAILARLHVQSTSDQQSPVLYPPIAAAAPASVVPEQAGNWAYTQPEMTGGAAGFTLATGLLGRLYLSGHLDRMAPERLALVREAVDTHKALREQIAESVPFWPFGLTNVDDPWVVLGLRPAQGSGPVLLTLWRRAGAAAELDVPLPRLRGARIEPDVLFPAAAPGWQPEWLPEQGVLRLEVTEDAPSARVIRLG